MTPIFVYGSGAFGTSLALSCLRRPGSGPVTLLSRREDGNKDLITHRENKAYLPGVSLPSALELTNDADVLQKQGIVLLCCPAQAIFSVTQHLKPVLNPSSPVVICAKGIDQSRLSLLSDLVQDNLPNPILVLSGPSFAREIAAGLPTAVVVASQDLKTAVDVCSQLRHSRFRCYGSADMVGVQVGGALKNVLAIACGIAAGQNLGHNAQSALLTRGLAEMQRLALALGAAPETLFGLAGVGDLTLTTSSPQSRNFSLGLELGRGRSLEDNLKSRNGVTEGVLTALAVEKLAQEKNIRLPICHGVYKILHQNTPIEPLIEGILTEQSCVEFYTQLP